MFFWRVINAEIWLRIFFDDHVNDRSELEDERGFSSRGDRAVAAGSDHAARLLEDCSANDGHKPYSLQSNGDVFARIPVRSRVIGSGSSTSELSDSLYGLAARGVGIEDGDLLIASEKTVSITQGRSFPVTDVR